MLPVTACVIAFNEQDNIRACLESVAFCSARIVVDSHSTDRTREIADGLGARVIERDWPGHIEQKNFAVDQAETEWVLCLDADERVTSELQARIEAALKAPQHDGYEICRRNTYMGQWIRWGGWYPDRKLRLFKRAVGRWGGINPHDHVRLDPPTPVGRLDADLEHYTYRSIGDHLETINYFAEIAAKEKLSRGQRWVTLNLLFNPPFKFLKMFLLKAGFLDGWRGFVVAVLGAFYVFLRYAKLWELIHVQGQQPGQGEKVAYGRRGQREEAPVVAQAEEGPVVAQAEEGPVVAQAEESGGS